MEPRNDEAKAAELLKPPEKYQYKLEDFLSVEPYQELYKYIDMPFVFQTEVSKMAVNASEVGFKGFKSTLKIFLEAEREDRRRNMLPNQTEFDGPYRELDCGEWHSTDWGIYRDSAFGTREIACSHAIMPVERLVNIDTGEVKLKLAFKRPGKDKKWQTTIVGKDVVSTSRTIVQLATQGISVTSNSASILVDYLNDIENRNYDVIPESESIGRLGYIDGEGFSPYVDDLVFDGDASFRNLYNSVSSKGSIDAWHKIALECRQMSVSARILLAASFASPLLSVVGSLPFFVHLWGVDSGTGKAQPLDTKIITPTGYKLMRDISVGDDVIGCDGKPHKVVGVFPQGKKEIFEVTFGDKTKTRCCKEHLWNVGLITQRNRHDCKHVMSLEEIMSKPLRTKKGYKYRIPVCKPVQYDLQNDLPLDPYLLGALIGDGCLTLKRNPANRNTTIYFSNVENDVIDRVDESLHIYGASLKRNEKTQCEYVVCGSGAQTLKSKIKELGLDVKSPDRFIPEQYLTAGIEQRKRLLEGLFDTDGSVAKNGCFSYSTKSERLASDISRLCQSLGYRAMVKKYEKRNEFAVIILTKNDIFKSSKHKERASSHYGDVSRTVSRDTMTIVDIKPVGEEECQCIMVDSDKHTYLCDDFIVTHNTVALMLAASVWGNPSVGAYTQTFNGTQVGQERTAAFLNHLPMCLDELQLTKDSRGKSSFDVYQLAQGVGRARGRKTGGVDAAPTWNCCFLTTGESPLTSVSSGAGAVNRVIDIECTAGSKVVTDGHRVSGVLKNNYGFAGPAFVKKLYESDKVMEIVREMYQDVFKELCDGDSTEKQAMAAAAIITADRLATHWIFDDGVEPLTVSEVSDFLASKEAVSAGRRAYDWLCDWVSANSNRFYTDNAGPTNDAYGVIEGCIAFINRGIFNRVIQEAGFSGSATLSYLKTNRLIEVSGRKNTKCKRINGVRTECVVLKLPVDNDEIDELPL